MMVDTMPTPIKSIARMPMAMSQCNRRCSGVKRNLKMMMAWCPLQFEGNPWPPPCAGRRTSYRRPTARQGQRVVRYRDAGRQDGRIEVDVATRPVLLGLDLLHDQRADLDGAAIATAKPCWGPQLVRQD